jgi:hypothetical protein
MRSNCIVWAIQQYISFGGYIRVKQSPVYPLLPRVSWSMDKQRWYRWMHNKDVVHPDSGWKKYLPVHAVWFKGGPKRDL